VPIDEYTQSSAAATESPAPRRERAAPRPLHYAALPKQQLNRWKDACLVAAIGLVFGTAYLTFLYGWVLFRN
jgi:hypothetical protein